MRRTFVNQTGDSNKFWAIGQNDNCFTVTWGKIGTEGRTNTKLFDDEETCKKEVEKLIQEKLSKGYSEIADLSQVLDKPLQDYRPMDDDVFWEVTNLFNWAKTGDDDAVLRPAVRRLASMPVEDICKFAEILSEKLFLLDGLAYSSNIGEESYTGKDEYFSVDYFYMFGVASSLTAKNTSTLFWRILQKCLRIWI